MRLLLVFDMRRAAFGKPPIELYQAALDQCEWGDKLGFERVRLLEHHDAEDGYLPSPIVLGAAVAGRTKNLIIELVALAPLYDPLRLAEDLAVLDLASNGRLWLTCAAGYRPSEYEMFGLNLKNRPSRMEKAVEVLNRAWTGEAFEYEGRTVRILPRPVQRPRPPIVLGGSSKAAAERAARIADDFRPTAASFYEPYRQAVLARGGRPRDAPMSIGSYQFLHVTHDPEGDWKKIAPFALHENNSYGAWLSKAGGGPYHRVSDADQLRAEGRYRVVTPAECVALAKAEGVISLKPLMGGLDPEIGWASLRLFEAEVLPHIR